MRSADDVINNVELQVSLRTRSSLLILIVARWKFTRRAECGASDINSVVLRTVWILSPCPRIKGACCHRRKSPIQTNISTNSLSPSNTSTSSHVLPCPTFIVRCHAFQHQLARSASVGSQVHPTQQMQLVEYRLSPAPLRPNPVAD